MDVGETEVGQAKAACCTRRRGCLSVGMGGGEFRSWRTETNTHTYIHVHIPTIQQAQK